LAGLAWPIILLLSGCAISEKYTISDPNPISAGWVKQEAQRLSQVPILESRDYQLTVQPYNARYKSRTFFVVVIPIPQGKSDYTVETGVRFDRDTSALDPPFVLELGLRAKTESVNFDTSQVRLEIRGRQSSPSGMVAMNNLECTFGRRFLFSSCEAFASSAFWQPVKPITIDKNNVQIARLRFNDPPPPPETEFHLEVGGLNIRGHISPTVRVSLSPREGTHFDTAP